MAKGSFSDSDRVGFQQRSVLEFEVQQQVQKLLQGSQKLNVIRPCKKQDGISIYYELAQKNYISSFQEKLNQGAKYVQFIPASGAASRMFKTLYGKLSSKTQTILIRQWQEFPFSNQMVQYLSNVDISPEEIAKSIMDEKEGLGLPHIPKGCVPFHAYPDGDCRTSFEEHAIEWNACSSGNGSLVFTIQNDFRAQIEALLSPFSMDWSLDVQHPATDTIAWDLTQNDLLRDEDGALVWRPGGHGALLKNLNSVEGDLVFLRNIDNVVDESQMSFRNRWQQIMGGRALQLAEERDAIVRGLREHLPQAKLRAQAFLRPFLVMKEWPDSFEAMERQVNRPIRVAGVVLNAGQPGGGPFWIRSEDGHVRPGIAEAAELPDGMMTLGTHFNPVDMACVTRNAEGHRFDLTDFADANSFFTAEKTSGSKPIRILERPGLWNGGMAGWLTEFVEIPSHLFAPVKTLFDLLDRRPLKV